MKSIASKILYCAVAVYAMVACTADDGDLFEFVEFGLSQKELVIPAKTMYENSKVTDSLKRVVNVFSNKECIVYYADSEVGWMRLKDATGRKTCRQIAFDSDGTFIVECDQNDDYARTVKLVVRTSSGQRCDTVYVRQSGKRSPSIIPQTGTMVIDGSSDNVASMKFETNIDDVQNIVADVSYPGTEASGWVKSVVLEDGMIKVSVAANPDGSNLRFATMTLSYANRNGTDYSRTVYLVQKTSTDGLGQTMSFADVRALGLTGKSVEITDNILIEGYVVSDLASGNAGENEKTSSEVANHDSYKRNIYFESADGRYGFFIRTATEEDNVFSRYDQVTLLLKGTVLAKENEPERYSIEGLTTANIIRHDPGTASVLPVKEKFISELTDDDIYTYVTLKECEFGVRKGPLTPVNDGYTISDNKGNLTKYPRIVRDSEGSSIYLYTNTTCPYRRNGVRLPYGSGSLSGVVVYELFPSYVYGDGATDEQSGNIGRYQIRHQSYSDIAFDQENSFSTVLVEFLYTSGFKKDGDIYFFEPTNSASGRFRHSTGAKPIKPLSTFNYIGMTGTAKGVAPWKNHIGCDQSIADPLGYSFAPGITVTWDAAGTADFNYGNTNSDGRGKVASNDKTEIMDGWRCKTWWNDVTDTPYSWIIEFSTKDISATHVSMQFTAYGGETSDYGKSPYFWKAQWSLTGDESKSGDWNDIADYVVPDGAVGGSYREWQLPALKEYNFPLPLEILGKDKVYIRLMPSSKVTNTIYFNEGTISKGTDASNAMDYFAIRYN